MAKEKNPKTALQRLYLARERADKGTPPNDDEFQALYPTLFELMTSWFVDPTHRTDACKLEVSVASGDWLFKLNSPGLKGNKSIMSGTFGKGLPLLELCVADASIPWSFYLKRKAGIAKIEPGKNGVVLDP